MGLLSKLTDDGRDTETKPGNPFVGLNSKQRRIMAKGISAVHIEGDSSKNIQCVMRSVIMDKGKKHFEIFFYLIF